MCPYSCCSSGYPSTSLWGRELKFLSYFSGSGLQFVDLLVRSWIEIFQKEQMAIMFRSTSLWGRELKCEFMQMRGKRYSRPPCEVVNWNVPLKFKWTVRNRRPPCEVVNWNILIRSAGCYVIVDLLVRSWIEMRLIQQMMQIWMSTSLWGRELKFIYLTSFVL